jgi:hypothetical protein
VDCLHAVGVVLTKISTVYVMNLYVVLSFMQHFMGYIVL